MSLVGVRTYENILRPTQNPTLAGMDPLLEAATGSTTGVSPEVRWLTERLSSDGGVRCRCLGLVGGRGQTCSYKILSLPERRGCLNLSVSKAEAKREVGANVEEV